MADALGRSGLSWLTPGASPGNAEKGWAVNAIRFEGRDGRDCMRLTWDRP